jgi:hypothetical protein
MRTYELLINVLVEKTNHEIMIKKINMKPFMELKLNFFNVLFSF